MWGIIMIQKSTKVALHSQSSSLTYFTQVASVVAACALLATFTSCSKRNHQTVVSKATQAQVLHQNNGTEPADLDPHIVTGVPEHHILAALFEGLVDEDPKDLSPVPGVAESWKVSKDGKVYTFYLNKNAKWSNGDPLTAHDFVYSWRRVLTPSLAGEYAYMLHYVKNAEAYNKGEIKDFSKVGAKALDDYTFQVTLRSKTPFFLYVLQHYATFPVHRATIEKFGKIDTRGSKWTRPGNMVSNGAFQLETWELNKVITVKRNPHYWDSKTVKLNGIHFHPIESQQTEERMFRAGELHVSHEIPINKIEVYKKENPELIRISPYLGTYFYRVNVTKPPLNDVKVRRALSMSVDRKQIVEKVSKGGQLPSHTFTPPGTSGYTAKATVPFNIEKAKALLAEAGYPNGKGFPSIEILYNTSENHKVIAEAVQQMWKKNLNISVTLANQDWKVYLSSQRTLDYGICRAGWIGDYPDPNTFLDMFVTGGGNNDTGWSNKKYDQLIAQAGRADTQAQRFKIFQEAEKILLEHSPVIPIYTYTRVFLISPDVQGWHPTILDHHPYKHVYLKNSKLGDSTEGVKLSQN